MVNFWNYRPLFNNWYRAAFHQPDPGSGSAIQLSTADAGIGSFDGIEISMGNGGAPRMYIINRELGGIGLYNGNSPASSMYINSDHKVGIGTESPTSLLHVNGTITSGDNATTQGTLTMLPSNGAAFFHVKNNNDNTLRISHGPVAGSDDLMTINSAGNVGIGTTTPSSKLEVNGDLKITDGTQGIGKVFTSDANGLASWVTPALTSSSGTLNYLPNLILRVLH
ncbi:MAG: hypothetical protein HWD58_10390 [Bacteroidota bacterium]|nr:MAG: hypothetical protein HWD58_10390 [Bacteroidota bacterium]